MRCAAPLLALLLVVAPRAPDAADAAAQSADTDLPALQRRLDVLVSDGFDRPDEALARLQEDEQADTSAPAAVRRMRLLARGLVQAQDGRSDAQATADRLGALAAAGDALAGADAELVRAVLDDTRGQADVSSEHARAALSDYQRLCDGRAGAPRPDCDYRSHWTALQLLARHAYDDGIDVSAQADWQQAADLAEASGDAYRAAWSLSLKAVVLAKGKDFDTAQRVLQQARRLADAAGSPLAHAHVRVGEALVASLHGDAHAARAASANGLALAARADSPRLQALFLNNLSDIDVKQGRSRDALREVEQALPIVRAHHDHLRELALLHNASLARLGLHQIDGAKQAFEQTLPLWRQEGDGRAAQAMREFSDALARAGDYVGALSLYHRERALAAQILQRNRDAALHELQTRYGRESQQRDIELLARDNALKTAELHNRALLQRMWTLLALTLAAALAFAILLYQRVRETQRQLERSQARLRVQSERDALTGLANRRHFQDVMRAHGAHDSFQGALLLIDIDHFKRINDQHGHAAGDEVLVQVAHRLQDAVREQDLVARWGGEEFLVFAPRLGAEALAPLAERLLRVIGATPITAGGSALRVTASIGHARFPLPPAQLAQTWEHAVNFVDMALYTAKSLGRNRAAGITAVQAANDEALRAIESDFEAAWADGRVTLDLIEGPQAESEG